MFFPCRFSLTEESSERILESSTQDITLDETKGGTYLSLDEIAVFLSHLANNGICIFVCFSSPCFLSSSRFAPSILKVPYKNRG